MEITSGTHICHCGIRNSYVFTQLLVLASPESLDLLEFGDGVGGVAKILHSFEQPKYLYEKFNLEPFQEIRRSGSFHWTNGR